MQKKANYILMSIAAVLLFSGCGIYNKYRRPEVKTDNLFGEMPVETDTCSSIADLKWHELFTDTLLQKLITRALDSNTDLNVAKLKVQEAQASLTAAKLAYLPSVQLNPEGSLSKVKDGQTSKTYTLGASASWEIDLFGKLTNAKRSELAVLANVSLSRIQEVSSMLSWTVLSTKLRQRLSRTSISLYRQNCRVLIRISWIRAILMLMLHSGTKKQKIWLAVSLRTSLSSLATKLVRSWLLLVRNCNNIHNDSIKAQDFGSALFLYIYINFITNVRIF